MKLSRIRSLEVRAEETRAEIMAWVEANVGLEEYSHIGYTRKEYSKLESIKNLEPAIVELLAAHQIRNDRETKFEAPILDDEDVPEYISHIRREIVHRIKAVPYQIFELGRLLCVVKKLLPHGEFDDWISKFLPISKSMVLNYIRVYRNCLGHPGILEYFKKSVLYEICSPRFPADFREFIFENITGEFDVQNKELLEVAIKWKKREVTPKSPEVRNLLKNYKFQSKVKKYIDELKNIEKFLKRSAKKINNLNKIEDPHPYLSEDDNEKDKRLYNIEKKVKDLWVEVNLMIRELESNQ